MHFCSWLVADFQAISLSKMKLAVGRAGVGIVVAIAVDLDEGIAGADLHPRAAQSRELDERMLHLVIGTAQHTVQMGTCNSFVEIYGNCDDNTYARAAYSKINIGQTYHLEIRDNTNGIHKKRETILWGRHRSIKRIGGPWRDITNVADDGWGLTT